MTDLSSSEDSGNRNINDAVTETSAGLPRQRIPKQIGQFHIKDVLASGGMGVVYRAVQEHPRRTVAVKVMKLGITSRSAMRRFEYESQVLARLRHPGIAQVFEAGTHDDGQGPVPYFAMEYIPNAKPITQYAKEKSLGTRERLTLLAHVCDAVYHGHQKGIIHRDLKPDNILVDPQGEVKIIDFGVARGTDSDLAVTTLQTDVGQLIGTLQYMSPEQCEADPDAIDSRSDVYALGVILYELVAGQLPYTVSRKHIFDGTRVIREHQPTKLSTINRTLRGDVETIVHKALEKSPDRRYSSTADFAKDIQLYLNGEAIHAHPPSAVYQLGLYARRHRTRLSAYVLISLIIAIAGILLTRSQNRVIQAEDAVVAAMNRATEAEKTVAASQAVGMNTKVKATDMLGKSPAEFSIITTEGKTFSKSHFARYKATVLNFVAANCPYCFKQVPLVAKIHEDYESRGVRFINVTMTMGEEFTAREAYKIFERYGSTIELARDKTNDIGKLFKVGGYPSLCALDSTGVVRYVAIGAKSNLMTLLRGQLDALILGIATPEEKLAEAEKLHRHTLRNNRETLGEGHRDTVKSMEDLAAVLTEQGKHNKAEKLYRDIGDVRLRYLGESDPQTLESMHKLAVVLYERNKPAEAEKLHRQTLEIQKRILGENHSATRLTMAHLGMSLLIQEKTEGAEPYITELIELLRRAAQQQDANAETLNEYAWVLLFCKPVELRNPAAALPVAIEAVKLSGRQEEDCLNTLAQALKMTGDVPAAIETMKEAITLISPSEFRVCTPRDFKERMELVGTLAEFIKETGDLDALEKWYRDDVAKIRSTMPAKSLQLGIALASLGHFHLKHERYSEAEPLFREVLEITRTAVPENHWRIYQFNSLIGKSLIGQGRFTEAEKLVVRACHHMMDNPRVPKHVARKSLEAVIKLYSAWGKTDEAARYQAMIKSKP